MVEKEREKDLGKVVTGGGRARRRRARRRQTTENTEKANHSAAEPQPNRCGGIKNPRARKRIYGLVVQRARRKQTTEDTEDTARQSRNQTGMAA